MTTQIDFNKVDNMSWEGIDHKDYPDYTDAFISECDYDGKPATDEQLEIINDNSDYKYEMLWEHLV